MTIGGERKPILLKDTDMTIDKFEAVDVILERKECWKVCIGLNFD